MKARLDSVCEIIMGQAPAGDEYNDKGEGLPLLAGAGDFKNGRPVAKKFTRVVTKECLAGDLVIGIRASIGDKVIADRPYCLGRGVAVIRPKTKDMVSRYLWHWMEAVRPELERKAKGATFKQVNRADIGELVLALPKPEEQRRIAAVLDQAEELRAKRRAAIALLDQLPQAIFFEMFGDPVSNPMGWPVTKLNTLGSLDRGVSKHRPRNAPELLGGIHPLIQTGDVANSDGYIRSYTSTYSDIGLEQSKKWPTGTLCITIAANIAKTGILTFDACFPDSVVGFTPLDSESTQFVRVWLSFLQKTLEDSAPESAQKNINLDILRNLPVPVPPLEMRKEFTTRIENVFRTKASHQSSLAELNALFESLQAAVFGAQHG